MRPAIAVFATLLFPSERMAEALLHLQALVEATRRLDHCIAYEIGIDPFEAGRIRLSELWPDPQSLERHLLTPHMAAWRKHARRLGLIERRVTAFDIAGAREL